MLHFWRNQHVSNTRYYKSILIRKYCIVKLECQLAFFFKPLKFWIEFRRALLVQWGLHTFKLDCLNNNFGILENLMHLIMQLAVSKLYIVVRHICVVIFAWSDRRIKKIAWASCRRVHSDSERSIFRNCHVEFLANN
jgi:hypothetical protein